MIDRKLFEKTVKACGCHFTGPVSDSKIEAVSEELGVKLPDSYKRFLSEYGAGGITGTKILGIESDDFSSMVTYTMQYREEFGIPDSYVVFNKASNETESYMLCFDTDAMKNGECPVIRIDRKTKEAAQYSDNFEDAYNSIIQALYNSRVLPYLDENKDPNEFPAGLGFKSFWMVIKNSSQQEIAKKLFASNYIQLPYFKGLEVAKKEKGKIMITSDFNNTNYVICDMAYEMFDEKFIQKNCGDFEEVYMFMTSRVVEAHGFLKACRGNMERMYYQDEDKIIDIGERIAEEKKKKLKLPHNFDEYNVMRQKKSFKPLNENMILELAYASSSVKKDTYPYEDVFVGNVVKV